ncbi:MAG: signal peptidase I [Ruminococcaceae bacterium]|nr:signal peptidase I [Oscillospiraceae bacterium]
MPSTDRQPSAKVMQSLFDWMSTLIGALVLVAFVYAFLFRVVTVSGESMERTLQNGDHLVMVTRLYSLDYGDVVVIGREGGEPIIKRVIGLPGDVIDINGDTGAVTRNGVILEEPYIRDGMTPPFFFVGPYTVPEGAVFAMGDNRCNSHDSRDDGAYSQRRVLGEAVFRLSPFNKFGSIQEG